MGTSNHYKEIEEATAELHQIVNKILLLNLKGFWNEINPKNYGHWTADDEHKLAKAINKRLKEEGLMV